MPSWKPGWTLAWHRSTSNRLVDPLGTSLATAAGVLLIGIAGRDIFDVLFHPEGRGALARMLARGVWAGFRRVGAGRRALALAGPVALLVVIGSWAALLTVGWALVYLPHIPAGFSGVSGGADWVDALNISVRGVTARQVPGRIRSAWP